MRSQLPKATTTHGAIVFTIAAAIMAASVAPAFAFDIGKLLNNTRQSENFKVIRVQALASMIADSNSHVNIYDANGWGLRSRAGVIPGAHLLTSDDKYDVANELPADKNAKLVFYCADLH
jgi:hypothetical protein